MHRLKTKLLEGPHAETVDRLGNFGRYLLRRFIDDRCFEAAGSLSYTSVLAAVPFAAVVFAALSAFPIFDQWTQQAADFVFANFVPEVARNLESALREFAGSARGLPAKGILALALSVGLTMWSVEKAFNRIWRVPSPKPKLLRFLVYWGLLTLGSLLVVALMALNSALSVYVNLADYTPSVLDGLGLLLAPLLLEFIAFTAAYWLIPHRDVPLRYAAAGGAVALLLFESLKWLFGVYLGSVSFERIYGAMALVPITLVWLYSAWVVILLGATIAATLSSFRYRPRHVRLARGIDLYWVLRVLARLEEAGRRDARPSFDELAALEPHIAEPMLRGYLAGLARIGLVQCDNHNHWWLAAPLCDFRLKDLHEGLGLRVPAGEAELPSRGDHIDDRVLPIIALLRGALEVPLQRPLSACLEDPAP